MILYNITFVVEDSAHEEWINWFKEEHIKDYLDSKCFLGARFGKITSHVEPGMQTYSVQFFANDNDSLAIFKSDFLGDLQRKSLLKYGTSVLSFASEMDHLGDFSV